MYKYKTNVFEDIVTFNLNEENIEETGRCVPYLIVQSDRNGAILSSHK